MNFRGHPGIIGFLLFSLCFCSVLRAEFCSFIAKQKPNVLSYAYPKKTWYGIYRKQKNAKEFRREKIGWAVLEQKIERFGAKDHFVRKIKLISICTKKDTDCSADIKIQQIDEMFAMKPPYALISWKRLVGFRSVSLEEKASFEEITGRRVSFKDGKYYVKDVTVSNEKKKQSESQLDETSFKKNGLMARLKWGVLLNSKTSKGDGDEYSGYDFSTLSSWKEKLEVVKIVRQDLHGVYSRIFTLKAKREDAKKKTSVRTCYCASDGHPIGMDLEDGRELREEPASIAVNLKISGKLVLDAFKYSPPKFHREVQRGDKGNNLVLELSGLSAKEWIPKGPHQVTRYDETKKKMRIYLGKNEGFPAQASQLKLYQSNTPRYPTLSNEVQALVPEVLDDAVTGSEKLRKIHAHVFEGLRFKPSLEEVSVTEVIDKKTGGCREYATLFNTLARAAGFPSKEVFGLRFSEKKQRWLPWVWNEVVLDGKWVSVDSTEPYQKHFSRYLKLASSLSEFMLVYQKLSGKTFEFVSFD